MDLVKKLLVQIIQNQLGPKGFQRDGTIWFKEDHGIIAMLALISDAHGFPKYSIELGSHVRELDGSGTRFTKKGIPRPTTGAWQIMFSLNRLDPDLRDALDGTLDMPIHARQKTVEERIKDRAIPILLDFETKPGLIKRIEEKDDFMVSVVLRRWLSRP